MKFVLRNIDLKITIGGFNMLKIIKIVLGVLVFLFGFYMFCDDSRRGIKHNLTKDEKRYFDIIETFFYISVMAIPTFLIAPLFE